MEQTPSPGPGFHVVLSQPAAPAPTRRTQAPRRVITEYAIGMVVALVLVVLGSAVLVQRAAVEEALADARRTTDTLAEVAVQPAILPGLATGDPGAIAAMDEAVRAHVLTEDLVRVKIWTAEGTIVYSDQPALIGATYTLSAEDVEALEEGLTEAELSDLSRPENRYERPFGAMLEVYRPVADPDGSRLLFETYSRYDAVESAARAIGLRVAWVVLGTLVVMLLVQLPLTARMLRQLRRSHDEQQRLLLRAVAAAEDERKRIAAHLHDGLAQDLTAASLAVSTAARGVDEQASPAAAQSLDEAGRAVRQSTADVRALLVELYPGRLHQAGLEAALADLAGSVRQRGLAVDVEVPRAAALPAPSAAIVYRVVQESLRNAAHHSGASRAWVRLVVRQDAFVLTIRDNGSGIDPDAYASARQRGHFGLAMLADLAADADATLELESARGHGTTVRLEMPLR